MSRVAESAEIGLGARAVPAFRAGQEAGLMRPAVRSSDRVIESVPGRPQWRGLWITVERDPAKAGGLGEVSKTIPAHLNGELGIDVRVIVPGLRPILGEGGWTDSGLKIELPLRWGGEPSRAVFNVLQRHEASTLTWVYAIANDRYFGRFPHLYFRGNFEPTLGNDPVFQTVLLFNRAAAALAPLLDPGSNGPRGLARFDAPCDFVMVHDWLTGVFLGLLPREYAVGRIFMLHNTYDEQRLVNYSQDALGLPHPPLPNTYGKFSPLESAVHHAHVVIANQNYVRSLFQRDVFDLLEKNLGEKLGRGRLYDMHHGISEDYDSARATALKQDGFVTLKKRPSLREGLIHFKRANKLALQRMIGLREDPDAVIFTWVGRFDPLQKGFYLVMDEARLFLSRHPRAQWILAGANSNDDPTVRDFLESVANDGTFAGRLYAKDHFVRRAQVIQICAGSDFFLMPSLYEPFGLAQLEAMSLGCIPVVHGVDGLRSTVSDPFIDSIEHGTAPPERVAEYGQVGVKIEWLNVPLYRQAIGRRVNGEPLNQQEKWVLIDSERKLRLALTRAIRLLNDPPRLLKIIENGRRFVADEHNWASIIRRYKQPIEHAVTLARRVPA
jgi:glycogen synthase